MDDETPKQRGVKIQADLGDLSPDLHFLVCFLRVSTSTARPNSDDGMFLRRILRVTHHHTFLYKKSHAGPPSLLMHGGGPRADYILIIFNSYYNCNYNIN